jgi:hypothetical protein
MRRRLRRGLTLLIPVAVLFLGQPTRAAGTYPRTIVASAKATSGATTIASTITIQINRLVEASRRDRLIAGLQRNGYQGFMDVMRPLPVIGAIKTQNREVAVKYAWETDVQGKHRLIVVADSPLFFLPGDEPKARPGYQLTVVQLLLDDRGAGTGLMAGAARVKPAPEEGIVLEDYSTAPVELTTPPPGSK